MFEFTGNSEKMANTQFSDSPSCEIVLSFFLFFDAERNVLSLCGMCVVTELDCI